MIKLFALLLTIYIFSVFPRVQSAAGNFGYYDCNGSNCVAPSKWGTITNSHCDNWKQSPINIVPGLTIYWDSLKTISVVKPGSITTNVLLQNTGNTLQLHFNDNWKINFGDGSGDCFKPLQIHWHWGSTETNGGEHTINGERVGIEGHIVSWNCDVYSNSGDAVNGPNGLYVFGFHYKISSSDNPTLTPVINQISNLIEPAGSSTANPSVNIPEINPKDFMPSDTSKYFRYEGSLTTPPCSENVMWNFFTDTVSISQAQLNKFRTLKFWKITGRPAMSDNHRPITPIIQKSSHGVRRQVFRSFILSSGNIAGASIFILAVPIMAGFYLQN